MPTYFEYTMDDGSTVLVESESMAGGVVKVSRGGVDVVKTGKKFTNTLASIRGSLKAMVAEFDALRIDEAEVKFGLKDSTKWSPFLLPIYSVWENGYCHIYVPQPGVEPGIY